MQNIVSTAIAEGKLKVKSPFNTVFVGKARLAGGKWDGFKKVWVFDARDEARVRKLCMEIYGTDGISPPDVVSLRVSYPEEERKWQGPITVLGRIVAQATGRDSGAPLGDGVVVEAGGFGSSGSVKNWYTTTKEGTVVLLHDMPREEAEKLAKENPRYEIVKDEVITIDRVALQAERARLMQRIAEIDALLTHA